MTVLSVTPVSVLSVSSAVFCLACYGSHVYAAGLDDGSYLRGRWILSAWLIDPPCAVDGPSMCSVQCGGWILLEWRMKSPGAVDRPSLCGGWILCYVNGGVAAGVRTVSICDHQSQGRDARLLFSSMQLHVRSLKRETVLYLYSECL